jgi:hypothetical protein
MGQQYTCPGLFQPALELREVRSDERISPVRRALVARFGMTEARHWC